MGWLKRIVLVFCDNLLERFSVVCSFYLYSIGKSPNLSYQMRSYFLTSYSLVNFIRAFAFYEKNLSYARILREESLLCVFNENSLFNFQGLRR